MNIDTREIHNIRMHIIEGELVHSDMATFLDQMKERVGQNPYVVLNLWGLDFVDSGGVSALVSLASYLRDKKIPLWIYKVNPQVKRTLENTHVSTMFKFSNSQEMLLGMIARENARKAAET